MVDITAITKRADAGEPAMQLRLAGLYETGTGVPVDRGKAAHWYRMAAE